MVLLTRSLLYVIGADVPDEQAHTASTHSVVARVAAGRTSDKRETISVSTLATLKEFALALRYNAFIRLHVYL